MREEARLNGMSFRRRIFTVAVGFLFLVMLVTAFFGKKGVMDIHKAKKRHAALQAEITRLSLEKSGLEKEIKALETDPRAVEREARDKLWLLKPGEKIIVIPKKK